MDRENADRKGNNRVRTQTVKDANGIGKLYRLGHSPDYNKM